MDTNAVRIVGFLTAISASTLATISACGGDESSHEGAGGNAGGGAAGAGATATGGGGAGGTANTDAASGGASTDGGTCESGCTCNQNETCDYSCVANCTVECLGGHCTADCPEGGCTLDGDQGASATYTCSGGNCATDCDGQSSCTLDCPGGGCHVTCDGASTCSVSCSETGAPCTVTCEAGAQATCTTGNCTTTGCGDAAPCMVDTTYNPTIDPANFTSTVDNPLFPLPVGATWTYGPPGELVTVTVTDQTIDIMGVTCVVVHDTVKSDTGEVLEDTYDWYAQDLDGNVWYFGEDTAEYVNGQVSTTAGSWKAGENGALPGIMMYASPMVGTTYREEYLACEAEDMGEVLGIDETASGPTGDYTGCVRIRDFTPLEPGADEIKTYCPGVGAISTLSVTTNTVDEILTSFMAP